jgi:hypothetical protein
LVVANGNSYGSVSVLLNTCVSTSAAVAIRRTSSTVIVSWLAPATGFVIESTASLIMPNWQRAAETPTTNNGRLEVAVSINQAERYFRLRKP